MHILHVALGGCLTAPNPPYGLTPDTGGHIAYILGAASAQARCASVSQVDIMTRAFDDPDLGPDFALSEQVVDDKLRILRLRTEQNCYLAKEALMAERPALQRAFADFMASTPRRPDVIHAHFADAVAVVRATAMELEIPVIYTPHSLGRGKGASSGGKGRDFADRLNDERTALIRSDAIVVSSRDEAEMQIEEYGVNVAARIHRIPPGVNTDANSQDTNIAREIVDVHLDAPDRPMILAIARPVRKKNLAGLMRAYLGDPALRARANLVILAGQRGGTNRLDAECAQVLEELEYLAAEAPGQIALPERHCPRAIDQFYRLAAQRRGVFVNPARHEPFGLTLLEAAQEGLPCVATREGGPADILSSLGSGRLIDPCDTPGLARAIGAYLTDASRWSTASRNARANIAQYDWAKYAERSLRVYGSLRATPRRAAPQSIIFASDIDGTLTGCREGARAFANWASRRDVPFVVATGRTASEARFVLAEWDLPEPDAIIAAVGSELYRRNASGHLTLCPLYRGVISANWKRGEVLEALREEGAVFQPDFEQRRWKLGLFGDAAEAERLRLTLRLHGLSARVVFSHGNLIDVLAPGAGKASALATFARVNGLGLADCIVAGDSGNDQDMLERAGRAILVANAGPELAGFRRSNGVHRARQAHAKGVMEGLAAFGLAETEPGPMLKVSA